MFGQLTNCAHGTLRSYGTRSVCRRPAIKITSLRDWITRCAITMQIVVLSARSRTSLLVLVICLRQSDRTVTSGNQSRFLDSLKCSVKCSVKSPSTANNDGVGRHCISELQYQCLLFANVSAVLQGYEQTLKLAQR